MNAPPGEGGALAALRADPRIAGAAVAPANADGERDDILVLPDPEWLRSEMRGAEKASARALRSWQTTYDLAYRKSNEQSGPNFDGWISSFTGEPIPLADMRDWLAGITARLLALPHGRVREIGCGTGLLVETVAPHCSFYEAADFSAVAIARLEAWLATRPDLAHVRSLHRAAHEGGDGEPVDLVIINSVAQHFPAASYLEAVLETAWRGLSPGGHIVIGDTRLLGAQAIFISAVELAKAPGEMSAGTLRRSIHSAWLSQSELLVDPGLFHRFARTRGGSVSVRLKAGRSDCEMTRYRCDVVLGKPSIVPASQEARSEVLRPLESVAALRDWLDSGQPGRCVLRGLANARVAADRLAHRTIAQAGAATSVAALRRTLAGIAEPAVDPASLELLASRHGRSCAITAPPDALEGRFDAWIGDLADGVQFAPEPVRNAVLTSCPPVMHALRRLGASLHGGLAGRLAAAEMPGRILPVLHAKHLTAPPCAFGSADFLPMIAP